MMPLVPVSRWSRAAVACALTLMSALSVAAQSTAVFLGERLSRTIPERMLRDDVPCAVVVVLEDGATVWTRAFGLADLATGRPMLAILALLACGPAWKTLAAPSPLPVPSRSRC